MIVQCMLPENRRNAGLGDPPAKSFTDVPESANAVIKRFVEFKSNEISKFCEEMKRLMLHQKEDVESAVTEVRTDLQRRLEHSKYHRILVYVK